MIHLYIPICSLMKGVVTVMSGMIFLAILVIIILVCIYSITTPDDAEDSFIEQEEKLEKKKDKNK